MIKVSVLYPNGPGTSFDMEYQLTRHIPMVRAALGPAVTKVDVEEGLGGGTPDAPATYLAMGRLYFESVDAFDAAFAPHATSILADIANYTNAQPVLQLSSVRV